MWSPGEASCGVSSNLWCHVLAVGFIHWHIKAYTVNCLQVIYYAWLDLQIMQGPEVQGGPAVCRQSKEAPEG